MPQTRFVTSKALSLGLRPIVVLKQGQQANARARTGRSTGVRPLRGPDARRGPARFSASLRQRPLGLVRHELTARGRTSAALFNPVHPYEVGQPC